MKNNKNIQEVITQIQSTANDLINRVFALNPKLKGKEETITGNLQSELSNHFIKDLETKLKGKPDWTNASLKIETFTKDTENKNGADLGIILRVHKNNLILEKVILVQAKIGEIRQKGNISVYNKDILTQAENMLRFTSDSFFFIYTEKGIKVFSALAVKFNNKHSINSKELYFHDFDLFISEFFKCFIGDHHIKNLYNNDNFLIKNFLEEQLNNLIQIEIFLNDKEEEKKKSKKK